MGRSPCCDKNGLKKGPWTQEEDSKLMQYIQTHGPGNWRTLPKNAGLQRNGKSCRLRWTNYLRPDIKRGRFCFEEEETIIQLHSILGNKWSAIAARLPGRTDNEIKNYWNTHIKKRLLRMGIDPVTHAPRLDYLDLSSLLGSAQLNLSTLLGLQNMVNPELLRLANLLSSGHQNLPALLLLLQKLQENQLSNGQLPNQSPINQSSLFQTTSEDSTILNQAQVMEGHIGQFATNLGYQNLPENQTPTSLGTAALPNYGYCMADDPIGTNASDNFTAQVMNNNQNFQFDSVLSTPLSSSTPTPLNSSSTFINSGSTSTEDERDSFCSNVFKFEIPESLNFDDFMQVYIV